MPFISDVAGCCKEEENARDLYDHGRAVIESLPGYTREHLFGDKASTSVAVAVLRVLAAADPRVEDYVVEVKAEFEEEGTRVPGVEQVVEPMAESSWAPHKYLAAMCFAFSPEERVDVEPCVNLEAVTASRSSTTCRRCTWSARSTTLRPGAST